MARVVRDVHAGKGHITEAPGFPSWAVVMTIRGPLTRLSPYKGWFGMRRWSPLEAQLWVRQRLWNRRSGPRR